MTHMKKILAAVFSAFVLSSCDERPIELINARNYEELSKKQIVGTNHNGFVIERYWLDYPERHADISDTNWNERMHCIYIAYREGDGQTSATSVQTVSSGDSTIQKVEVMINGKQAWSVEK